MSKYHSKYIIVGAGLSGLTSGYQLQASGEHDFVVLESRAQVGGRIYTKNGVDLGATWFQNHHTYVKSVIDQLKIKTFSQFSAGKSVLVYNTMSPAHYFESDQNSPSAHRIEKGSEALVHALSASFQDKIQLNTPVISITEDKDILQVKTKTITFTCDKIIITLPPKLVKNINFSPQLPEELTQILNKTHTWMSNAIKVGITFKSPFWKAKGLSGTVISQISEITELYDHCNYSDTEFSLMGFVNEGLRELSPTDRKERILKYLETYLGGDIRLYTNYYEKDWSADPNTSSKELNSVYMSPSYGSKAFQEVYMNGKLFFSGTETSPISGGYMDGAIYSGLQAAIKICKL
ncbi:NAD(P)/FAD-dependent oxidoreductase [Formosa sp. PL04]|uniref:flavin monoamine oxidase family protein n=1 Tax=Formosa sp. PL04 TaxID=3081755 RepID=UPI0029811141|nr:NAD(P)/FAD-dependent oxidoreductase [Formosa sp. PL04]MDW5288740.1 NAD(P)/FAD-dependent oxidoreductase [Formosa sp. PL04]